MKYLLIEPDKGKVYFNYFFQTKDKKFIIKYQQHPQYIRYVLQFKLQSTAENYIGNLLDNNSLKINDDLIKKYKIESYCWSWYDDDIFIEKTPTNIKDPHKEDFFKNSISYAEDCENEEIKIMFKNAKKNGYSNASDVTEAFGVKIISADSLIEYYEEIRDCNHLNWKIIDKSYKNNDWQDDEILFQNLD
jgi:hypothetical protein